jgi:hypothetical protein
MSGKRTRRVKASGELVAQVGYGQVDVFHGEPVAVSGIGHELRVLDGDGYTGLKRHEDVLLRHIRRDRWWLVVGDDMADAFTRALAEGRSIDLDDPTHVRGTALPANPVARDAVLARLGTRRPQ